MTDSLHPVWPDRLQTWLRRLLLLGPIWYGFAAVYVIAHRYSYPFELEWMEGGSLIQMLRVLHSLPIYVRPSLDYIPYIYPPLYYYVAALVARLTGIQWFTSMRLVSIGATLGTAFIIYRLVRETTGSRYWGVIAVGLFAASFRPGGFWFDIARVDMQFIFLMMAGAYLLLLGSRFSGLAAGLMFGLAFYTKQTALLPALAALTYLLLERNWRAALQFALAFGACSFVTFALENSISGGWYAYYVFHLPGLHRIPQPAWLALSAETATLLGAFAVAVTLAALPFLAGPREIRRGKTALLGLLTIAAIVVSVVGNAQPGGYENASLPALATIAVAAGLGGHWLESLPQLKYRSIVLPVLFILLGVQFFALQYSVEREMPTAADRRSGEELVASLRQTQGKVLVPFHGYLALMAGKAPSAHQVMLWLISGKFGETDGPTWSWLSSDIDVALKEQQYQRILLDRREEMWQQVPIYYNVKIIDYPNGMTFYPVTGGRARPTLDCVPK